MTAVPGGGVRLGPTPPGAIRRTTTLVVAPLGDWASGQRLTARGRDLVRSPEGEGDLRTTDDEFSFDVDAQGLIAPLRLGRSIPEELRGEPAQHGLRKKLAQLRSRDIELLGPEGGLYDAMLDDVVGTSLASGYGRLYEGSSGGTGDLASGMRLTCIGFGTMHARGEVFEVQRYFEDKSPSLEFVPGDELTWHQDLPMRPHTFRRRRMLQVAPSADGAVAVTGYFRDTFMRPDEVELVVHEYRLDASASGRPLVLDRVEAVPGDLPLEHCPLAARSALRLEGLMLSEVEAVVRREIAGPGGCTHLNDALRALRLTPNLLATLTSEPHMPTVDR